MTPSSDLLEWLRGWEGVAGQAALTAYQDTGGVWTIGYGHTSGVRSGQTITQAGADALLSSDLVLPSNMVTRMVLVPVLQCQYDALCAFAFNVGAAALHGSTLLQLVNSADFNGAALQFTRWDHDHSGKEVAGLYKRRVAEQRMFLDSDYSMRP